MQARLSTAAMELPGHQGTLLLPADQNGEWLSMVRFRTAAQLSAWMRSSSGITPIDRSPRPRRDVLDRVGGMLRPAVPVQVGAHGVESGANVGITCDAEQRGA